MSPVWGLATLVLGLVAAALAAASLMPWSWPAWPGLSLGLLALMLARRPGPPMQRAVGSLCALVAVLVGTSQIALVYLAGSVVP